MTPLHQASGRARLTDAARRYLEELYREPGGLPEARLGQVWSNTP